MVANRSRQTFNWLVVFLTLMMLYSTVLHVLLHFLSFFKYIYSINIKSSSSLQSKHWSTAGTTTHDYFSGLQTKLAADGCLGTDDS